MPSAVPTCAAVLSRPAAVPRSASATAEAPSVVAATEAMPMPSPHRTPQTMMRRGAGAGARQPGGGHGGPGGDERDAADHQPGRRRVHARRRERPSGGGDAERQQHEPGIDGPQAERVLELQAGEHAAAARGRGEKRAGEQSGPERTAREQGRRHERMRRGALAHAERGQQERRAAERGERQGRQRSELLGLREREHEQAETAGRHARAEEVEVARNVVGLTLGQDPWRQREHGEPDRDVDEEDPTPAECLRDHPPEHEPGRPSDGGDPRPGRDGALPRVPSGEGIDDHGQRGRARPGRHRDPGSHVRPGVRRPSARGRSPTTPQ